MIGVKPKIGSTENFRMSSRSIEKAENLTPDNLGGFQLVPVVSERSMGGGGADRVLDQYRSREDIVLGTHVFHPEGTEVPMVPTGEIYVVFESRTSKKGCKKQLKKLGLEVIENREKNEFIVRVTAASPNPIKAVIALQQSKKGIDC